MFTVCRLLWSASILLVLAAAISVWAQAPQPPAGARMGNYNQWRLALDGVSQPTEISAPEGFRVELVRSAQPNEGSWISLAWDSRGRLVVGREAQGLLRFDFSKGHKRLRSVVMVNNTVHEPRGLLFAHDSLYVSANNDRAIYRLRDLDSDGVYERVDEIRRLDGGVGHGRNGMALGPDGKIYLACGNNVRVPGDVAKSSPYAGYGLDRLPPCDWNKFLFDADVAPPAGFIARFDEHGEQFELVAGGFRNPYDLAFNAEGDLFTYDADMEWDVGAPWYRPTTVMHVVPGGEYGWRQGSSVWPDAFPDCLPRVCDVGLGSPTGVVLGEKANFPEKYKQALFVLDWAYGRILAVHLSPRGASYQGVVEPFIQGRPLNVTDATIGPDGALYFVVGGRRTQSALYRVTYTGGEKAKSAATPANSDETVTENRQLVKSLLSLPRGSEAAMQDAWPHLAHADPYVRQAARTAVGSSAPSTWKERLNKESAGDRAAEGLLTLARAEQPADALAALPEISRRMSQKSLSSSSRAVLLRAAQIVLARHRTSVGEKERAELRPVLEALAVAKDAPQPLVERQLLLELLVELQSPAAPKLGVAWLAEEQKPAAQLLWLHLLRNQQHGWNQELRGAYLAGLKRAEKFPGAQYLPRFVTYIRSDVMHSLSKAERESFAVELSELGVDDASPVPLTVNRPLVKVWQLADLQQLVSEKPTAGAVERGAKLYRETLCIRCHRWNQEGGQVGPDLTNVAGRFGRRELLEAIVEPSRVVDEKYRTLVLSLKDGTLVSGVLVGGREKELYVAPNHFLPAQFVRVSEDEIAERGAATASLMPVGLLNSLSPAEVLDLLAFLESGLGLDLNGALKHNP